jgi:hypothetical protein
VKFYVYPMPRDAVTKSLTAGANTDRVRLVDSASTLVGADDLVLTPPSVHLYRYLREAGQVVPIAAV